MRSTTSTCCVRRLSRLGSKLLEEEREEQAARQKAKEERERVERNAEMFPLRRKRQAEQK